MSRTYSKRIYCVPIPAHQTKQLLEGEGPVIVLVVLGEHVLKLLGPEPALTIISPGITAMLDGQISTNQQRVELGTTADNHNPTDLRLVNRANIDAEQGVRNPRVRQTRGIREAAVDDEHRYQREDEIKPQLAEPDKGVPGVDFAIVVAVPEPHMLLEDSLGGRGTPIKSVVFLLQHPFSQHW